MPINYPPYISLGNTPTPLQKMQRFTDYLREKYPNSTIPDLWVKRDDMTEIAASGNKIRKLEFHFQQALSTNCTHVITAGAIQSNHCRATALMAARLGLKTHLVLRADEQCVEGTGNLFLGQLAGATITWVPRKTPEAEINKLLLEIQQTYSNQTIKAFCIPIGGSNALGAWGYIKAIEEIKTQCQQQQINPSALVVADGSGGTHAGLVAGCELHNWDLSIIGMAVCDSTEYFQRKVKTDIAQLQTDYTALNNPIIDIENLTVEVDDNYIGDGYAIASKPIFDMIERLTQLEAIVLDPVYSAKAFLGLTQYCINSHWSADESVIFLHTGGIFGLLAQTQQYHSFKNQSIE